MESLFPDFLLPFGPFHLVFLHLPIGVLCAMWVVEFFTDTRTEAGGKRAFGVLYGLLLLATALAIILGLAYSIYGKYDTEIDQHALWGNLFGGSVLIGYIVFVLQRKSSTPRTQFINRVFLVLSTALMVVTGHLGGELVHGKGFLKKAFKEDTRRVASQVEVDEPVTAPVQQVTELSLSAEVDSAETENEGSMDFMDMGMSMDNMVVAPLPSTSRSDDEGSSAGDFQLFEAAHAVFERHCFNCHGATKQKGGYRIDLKDFAFDGGKSGLKAIVPNKSDDSELLHRIYLARDDDETMPPEEKEALTDADKEAVKDWIAAGAFWPDKTKIALKPSAYLEPGDSSTDRLFEALAETGAKAEYNAWGDDSVRVDLGVVDPGGLETALKGLKPLSGKLKWLDASQLDLPDTFYETLDDFPGLERLHLDGTNVTDGMIAELTKLPNLNYLNLYNTEITDAALDVLADCEGLKKLFLRRTKVSAGGIERLKNQNPDLLVVY